MPYRMRLVSSLLVLLPGLVAAQAPTRRHSANTSDEALPMPKDAGSVLPSAILAQLPPAATITASTDCSLGGLSATIDRERKKATEQQTAYHGNPGNSGLGRTPAERAVLEHAEDSELDLCGMGTETEAAIGAARLAGELAALVGTSR